MKPLNYTLLLSMLSVTSLATLHGQNRDWGSTSNGNWSDTSKWSGGDVPDTNAETARITATGSVSINVDGNYTIRDFVDTFAGDVTTNTVGGAGTLTIDRNSASTAVGIANNNGLGGSILSFTGNVQINNSQSAITQVTNANSTGNIVRFASGSTLTLSTILQTTVNSGQIQFNGTLAASTADLQIASNNVSFGTGHISSGFGRDIVFSAANSKLTITAGTVLNTGRKFQVNGNNSTLQLDGANTINSANIVVGGTNNFTLDVNASQTTMGILVDIGGTFTIDLDSSVASLWFANSSSGSANWAGGSVSILGFRENVIRFGTTDSGLTLDQLALIDGGIYSLSSSGFLTAIPEPSAFAALAGLGALGFVGTRRHRQTR
jgi:hypothetical protein